VDASTGTLIQALNPAETVEQILTIGASTTKFTGSVSMGTLTATDGIFSGFVGTVTMTVASLPVTAATGLRAFVTNALAPAFGAMVVGGGTVGVPVYYDGAFWRVG
jgi:hypothetical protein